MQLTDAMIKRYMRRGIVQKIARRWNNLSAGGRITFSQAGEDILIDFVMGTLRIDSPIYLDIGANNATLFSNTYLFYTRGCRGVCIEPNPSICQQFSAVRPHDLCLNIGVASGEERTLPFYILDASMLSTFDRETAQRCCDEYGHRVIETIDVPVAPIARLIDQHMKVIPNFVSLDTEGHDLSILNDWDFERHRPEVICVETLAFDPDRGGAKIPEIASLMLHRDYFNYADTYINTIFVDRRKWEDKFRG